MTRRCDVLVAGAGSGGIGTALAAARLGLRVLVIERAGTIGGTAVNAGVHAWEPGVGGTGIPFDIYQRLKRAPQSVALVSYGRHRCWPLPEGAAPFPGGEHVIDPDRSYADSLQRHGGGPLPQNEEFFRTHCHAVVFEPDAYVRAVTGMLAETGRCEVLTGVEVTDGQVRDGQVAEVRLNDGTLVRAQAYVDCTGDAALGVACGCEAMTGQEGRDRFDEPHAPEQATDLINGVSLLYRVMPTDRPGVEPTPDGLPEECWWRDDFPSVHAVQCPAGGYSMNTLPTMEGGEFAALGPRAAYDECRRRVLAHWRFMQSDYPEFRSYRLTWIAPEIGVRESRRVVGEYVLTENDLLAGLSGQRHADIIAIADHALDTHGAGGGCGELAEPYGVPYPCLIPRGFANLLVACRAISFSSLAASSCRLSRTMIQLGQAAGTACALAAREGVALPDVPADDLRAALRHQHVQLEWPMENDVRRHIGRE